MSSLHSVFSVIGYVVYPAVAVVALLAVRQAIPAEFRKVSTKSVKVPQAS